jgi:Transcriptional Coactivator p15 (PC4)
MTVRKNWGRKNSEPKVAVVFPITVAEWPRNEREVLRILISNFRGRLSIDVRVWFRVAGGKLRPGRRGVSLRLTEISDIRDGLRKASEIALELGLLDLPAKKQKQ